MPFVAGVSVEVIYLGILIAMSTECHGCHIQMYCIHLTNSNHFHSRPLSFSVPRRAHRGACRHAIVGWAGVFRWSFWPNPAAPCLGQNVERRPQAVVMGQRGGGLRGCSVGRMQPGAAAELDVHTIHITMQYN